MDNKIVMVVIVLAVFGYISCTPKETPLTGQEKPIPAPAKPGGQSSWEEKWQNTILTAQKEGKVVVYATLLAPAIREQSSLLKQKYGIELEIATGRGSDLRAKLLRERASGLFLADIFISGLNTIFGAVKKSGVDPVEPVFILPEVVDRTLWFGGKYPFADEDKRVFSFYAYPVPKISINTDIVKAGEIQSQHDLLDPKWKGKMIISDPSVTGSGFNDFSTMLYNKVLDLDYYRQFVKQEPVLTRDLRLQVDWLAKGRYPIALWAESTPLAEYKSAGAPIDSIHAREGVYLTSDGGNLVLMSNAPHPGAASIFINWLLSKEGQIIMQKAARNQSTRTDISTEGVDLLRIRSTQVKYVQAANEIEKWVLEEQDKYLELARQIFGPLIK